MLVIKKIIKKFWFPITICLMALIYVIWNVFKGSKSINDVMSIATGNKGGVNNPLNIRNNSSNNWVGKVSSPNDVFESFDTLNDGIRAAYTLLHNYMTLHNCETIFQIIERWAPPSDNNPTDSYIDFVSQHTGIDSAQILNFSDLNSIIVAMSIQEGNHVVTLDDVNNALI